MRSWVLRFGIFTAALCSLSYELIFAQVFSLTFGGTIEAYTVSIGVFLFSAGVGSLLADRFKPPLTALEAVLGLIGCAGPILILALDRWFVITQSPLRPIGKLAALLILSGIGLLTGFELPIVFRVSRNEHEKLTLLSLDYVGSFVSGLLFAFVLFPIFGLVGTILWTAAVNWTGVAALYTFGSFGRSKRTFASLVFGAVLILSGIVFHGSFALFLSDFLRRAH